MQKSIVNLDEIKLVGIKVRTNLNTETNPSLAKIGHTVQEYFQKQISDIICNRKSPGKTFCAYTEYQSDYTGDYTYFIGEEVKDFDSMPDGLSILTIPSQKYAKFTTEPEAMPKVVIDAWQKIWQMTPENLGGNRLYKADFEIYDHRAQNPMHTALDIYIGIE